MAEVDTRALADAIGNSISSAIQQAQGNTSNIVTALNSANKNTSLLITAIQGLAASEALQTTAMQAIQASQATIAAQSTRIFTGTFTMTATTSLVVPNANVLSTSEIFLFAINAPAGTLMGGTRSLYRSAKSAGVSFTVATASGVAAAGTEQFSYLIVNP